MVAVYLKVNPENKVIDDIKFESYGCASNIATGSIITELAKGKTIEEAKEISWKDASEALGGLPKIKAHCSVLAVEGLREAITNYEEKHGLVKEKKPTTVDEIKRRLKSVMNPLTGLDIVRGNLITDVKVEEGTVSIWVDLPENHIFAANIREEIKERIETLWDVKQVELHFREAQA
jgi:metal-sulfur cluster biosynthetic enzyme